MHSQPAFLSPFIPALRFRTLRRTLSSRSSPSSSFARSTVRCCIETPSWKRVPVDVDCLKDEQLQTLETQLHHSLQQEDYQEASAIREKLVRLQSAAYVDVLTTNMKFYRSFVDGSIVDIASVWLQDKNVTCKHPTGPMSVGYLDVLNHFSYLFSSGIPQFQVQNVVITMRGTNAIVTCEEHLLSPEEHFVKKMAAVNIYQKRNGQWYLYHHSATPVFDPKLI